MITKETYTRNNVNPAVHEVVTLYSNRELTEEELFYINEHGFDNASAYATSKGWKLIRNNNQAAEKEATKDESEREQDEPKGTEHSKELLEKRMQEIKMPNIITVSLPLLMVALGLTGMISMIIEGGFFRIVFGLFCGALLSIVGISLFACNVDDYKLARSDFNAYKRKVIAEQDAKAKKKDPEYIRKQKQEEIEREYQQAVASQKSPTPWTVRYETHPCPYCGHYKVRYAKWDDKKISVAFWGAASSTIDMHYKCDSCNKMW